MPRIHRSSLSVFIGLTGIAFGVFYLARSFGYLYGIDLIDYWPLFLMIYGINRIINPCSASSYFWGTIYFAVGALFLGHNLHVIPFNPASFWPVLLIVFGVWTLIRPRFGVCCGKKSDANYRFEFATGRQCYRRWSADSVVNDNELDITLMMSNGKYICTGKDFRGGSIRLRAAGAEIDLTSVETPLDEILLEVDLKLGGIELRIPQNWTVNYLGKTIMGSVQDHTRAVGGGSKKLVIQGEVALAGIEIRN